MCVTCTCSCSLKRKRERERERERELIALVISTYMYIVLLLSSLSSLCHFMMTAVHVYASVSYNFVLTSLTYLH